MPYIRLTCEVLHPGPNFKVFMELFAMNMIWNE